MAVCRLVAGVLHVLALGAVVNTACGQNFPNRPIRLITTEAGSGSDLMARLVAQTASASLRQQMVVDNRGISSIEMVAKARADGYTLLLYGPPLWLTPFMRAKITWDPVKDFSPVTLTTNAPNILVVHPSIPAHTVQELVALAKADLGRLNYASGSTGTTSHLAAEMFNTMTGVTLVRVAYPGSGPGINALIGGQVQVMFPSAGGVAAHIKSGKLRALAVTTARPSALAPGLPTLATFVPGYESSSILGIFVPARTPQPVIGRLNREIVRALNVADVKERLFNSGLEVVGSTPDELAVTVKSEMTRYGKLIKDAGIREE